jgi:hypothetical protein
MNQLDYFEEINSPQKAYFLGWIVSDGHLTNDGYRLMINITDADRVSFFKNQIPEGKVYNYKNRPSVFIFVLNSKFAMKQLNDLGIPFGRKSDIVKPPEMQNDLQRYFWSGMIEGDGSFFYNNGNKCLTIHLTGNQYMCSGFRDYMGWNASLTPNGDSFNMRKCYTKIDNFLNDFFKLYNDYSFKNDMFLRRKIDKINNSIFKRWEYEDKMS